MKVKEFLKELHSRKNESGAFRTICQENNISYKKLAPLLKELNFEYDKAAFEWVFLGENEPFAMEVDLADKIPMRKSAAAVQQSQPTSAKSKPQQQIASAAEAQQDSSAEAMQPQPQIITDQLFDIVDLLQQINNKIPGLKEVPAIAADLILEDPEAAPLALQLHRINQSVKARKTINISQESAHWLDNFSAIKGFKIGDLVTLAVMQLKDKIDPGEK